jgi:predicted DNA-binding transcriptional regulator AlpA
MELKKLIVRLLKETAEKIDSGNCELSESEAMELISILSHEVMSKASACDYLNLSRSRFDDLVREKKLPKGRKEVGWKELRWYKDELDIAVRRMKNKDIIW